MPILINSPFLQFNLNPKNGTWSLHGPRSNDPYIEDAWMLVGYKSKNNSFDALQSWHGAEIHGPKDVISPHGVMQQTTLILGPDMNGLHYKIEFALPETHPLFLWRLTIENQGELPYNIERIQMMQAGFFPKEKRSPSIRIRTKRNQKKPSQSGTIRPHPDIGEPAFFSNGWQSWSFTGTLGPDQSYANTRLGLFARSIWFNDGTPHPRKNGHFGSDMFGVLGDRLQRTGILAGFLSQKEHFGSLEASTNPLYPALALWANGDQARLDPGAQMTTDWAAIQFVDIDSPDPLGHYLDAVSREHILHTSILNLQPSIGWCSWYQFFQDISEEKMRANLKSAAETKSSLPFDLFQIDDGFQAQIGDWLDFAPTFPEGIAPIARKIQDADFTPGLWLAPFIVHSKSQLKRDHPDWLLHNFRGQPVNAGFIWNNFNTALDLTHPEALNYVKEVVRTATHDWGFQFLKLDFLYAAAIKGRYQDQSKTRAQVLRMGLKALREAAGSEVHLLGCGVPLGPSIGVFDSMRIGADVAPKWQPSFLGLQFPFRKEYPMPSTRNAIHNTITRAPLHKRWWINDPDCLMVRPDCDLTLAEVQSLATVIALSGGPLLLSDDLPHLPPERLRIAEQLVPLIGQTSRVLDWFDSSFPQLLRLDLENTTGNWHLLAVFNWNDEKRDIHVPLKKFALPSDQYFAREFWDGFSTQVSDGLLTLNQIPAHGVRLLALRPPKTKQACYLGSDLHISQGLEVVQWSLTSSHIRFRIIRPGKAQGHIELYLQHPPTKITVNGNEIGWQEENDIYRLQVRFEQSAEIEIR